MMQCSAVLGFLFVICLPITAEPVGSSPEDNKAQYPANIYRGKPVREEAILQLADFVKHGDTLLKERLQASYTDLKKQLKQGDSLLKERMTEGDDQLNEQRKDGDSRLKQELDEDVEWLKGRVQEAKDRMKEDLEEAKKTFTEEMSDLKEALAKLQDSVKTCSSSSSAVTDALKQQMDDVQAELGSTRDLLQTTQTELGNTKDLLQSTQTELGITKDLLQTTQTELGNTKELLGNTTQKMEVVEAELGNTTQKAETTEQKLERTREELQTAQAEVGSLKAEVDGLQSQGDTGSTFTRWGRKTCPDNTSLVYSGVAGGTHYSHTGGASNYLCLVRDPQLDNKTDVPSYINYLYGAEYQHIKGHHDQDVVCSVCRAPQASTIMVPATITCPADWTLQYKGHLMSEYHNHKGRTEYVCVDEVRENDDDGDADENGALFYHVVTRCGSLPCPPYVNNVVVTCVVCSK